MADPASIPLGIRVPEQSGPNMGTIGQFAQVQNWLNTSRLFQQTFAARQRAGEIMAQSPDLDTAMQTIMRDPLAGAFAPELGNLIRQQELTQTQIAGERQTQFQSALGMFMKSVSAAGTNPTALPNIISANMRGLPSGVVGDQARGAIGDLTTALLGGTTETGMTPAQTFAKFKANLAGILTAGGMTPEAMSSVVGSQKEVDLGGYKALGVQQPAALGGGFQETSPLPMTVGPRVEMAPVGPGGATVPLAIGPGGVGIAPGASGQYTPGAIGGTPSGSGPVSGMSTPSSTGLSIAGPTMPQQEYYHKRTGDMTDYEKSLDQSVNNGSQLYRNMSEIMSAAEKAHMGGGAEAFKNLGSALQSLGVNNSIVDQWANGSLASSQVIDKVALTNAMTQLRQQLESSGSRINRQEFAAFLTKNPNLTTDPRAMIEIFNLWNSFYQRDKAEHDALNTAKKEPNFDIGSWPNRWQNSSYMQQYAPGTPFTGQGIPGAMPEKTPDGIFAPKTPEELKSIPDGTHYRRPGDPPDKVRVKGGG